MPFNVKPPRPDPFPIPPGPHLPLPTPPPDEEKESARRKGVSEEKESGEEKHCHGQTVMVKLENYDARRPIAALPIG